MQSVQNFAKHSKIRPPEEYRKNAEDLLGRYTYSNPRAESENIIHYEQK